MEPGMRIGIVLRVAMSRLRAFPRATRGNIAMIFGLALIPLCLAVGAGLDMSRAMITRVRLGAALDAAGLAVGSQPGMSQDQMQKLAREYFKQNYTADKSQYGTPDEVTLTRPDGSQTITLSTQVRMPTVLMRIVGVDTMSVGAQTEITWGQTKLWVALVLDNTGSMCEPGSQPCPTPISTSKIVALKAATHNLLQMLQNAASNDGDVQVSIIPFSKDVNVGTDKVNEDWIDWTNWEAPPPNSTPDPSVGWGSDCPYGSYTSPYGYGCMVSPANSGKTVSTVPSYPFPWDSAQSYSTGNQVTYNGNIYIAVKSGTNHTPGGSYWAQQNGDYTGYICPDTDNGRYNSGDGSSVLNAAAHHYNGCYDSIPTNTQVTTITTTQTRTDKYSCSQVDNGPVNCGSPTSTSYGSTSTSSSTTTESGYTSSSYTQGTTSDGAPNDPSDNNRDCRTRRGVTTCTWTRTIKTPTTRTDVYRSGGAPFTHTWHANDHSTWTGCIMDRPQDDDTKNTDPASTGFPAENTDYCLPGTITPLAHDWDTLSDQVDAMTANGNTNQTVGLAWGWQTLTNTDPYDPGDLPVDTRKVLILLTDGQNTQNRWSGSASSIDARTKKACQNIKDDNITVYTVLVMAGSSSMLKGCASDDSKYFELTAADQIVSTFQTIGTQITNLRVSL
jgi:Flp pilus assembly protein TadG